MRSGRGGMRLTHVDDIRAALAATIARGTVWIAETGLDVRGGVVAYERNERSSAVLRTAGVKVLEIVGAQLGRGRGGPRCMSCLLNRAGRRK